MAKLLNKTCNHGGKNDITRQEINQLKDLLHKFINSDVTVIEHLTEITADDHGQLEQIVERIEYI